MTDSSSPQNPSSFDRRNFIVQTAKSAGGLALLGWHPALAGVTSFAGKTAYTVQDVIQIILKTGGLSPIPDTVDTIKAGSADQVVTGIVTTMFSTISVIQEAAKRKANFIIAHEPTFYNHRDDPEFVPHSGVVLQKQQLLEKLNITIWRFHDYCHSLRPDAIKYGVVKKAEWLPYFKPDEVILTIPALTLQQLVDHLKSSLGINHVRIIGDPAQMCSRIALMPGSAGGKAQMSVAESTHPDVLVLGELSEWETAEYIRDERLLGGKTALLILGHNMSEDPGMEWVVDWLKPQIPGVEVAHIPSGDPFIWL